jgi:hypothetical protein
MRDSSFCFWHDPAKADDVADAQRLGGIRRRRERSVATAFDFTGLSSIESIRRLLEIAATDALSLETSVARVRALISVSVAAAKLLETGELAEQLATIEVLVRRRADANPATDFG